MDSDDWKWCIKDETKERTNHITLPECWKSSSSFAITHDLFHIFSLSLPCCGSLFLALHAFCPFIFFSFIEITATFTESVWRWKWSVAAYYTPYTYSAYVAVYLAPCGGCVYGDDISLVFSGVSLCIWDLPLLISAILIRSHITRVPITFDTDAEPIAWSHLSSLHTHADKLHDTLDTHTLIPLTNTAASHVYVMRKNVERCCDWTKRYSSLLFFHWDFENFILIRTTTTSIFIFQSDSFNQVWETLFEILRPMCARATAVVVAVVIYISCLKLLFSRKLRQRSLLNTVHTRIKYLYGPRIGFPFIAIAVRNHRKMNIVSYLITTFAISFGTPIDGLGDASLQTKYLNNNYERTIRHYAQTVSSFAIINFSLAHFLSLLFGFGSLHRRSKFKSNHRTGVQTVEVTL